jgi:hypothetical protein
MVRVEAIPVAAEAITVSVGVKAVKPGDPIDVTAAKTAEGEPVTTEVEASEAMEAAEMEATEMTATKVAATEMTAAATVAATTVAAAARVGDLGQGDDRRDEHCEHQTDEFTTHDTLLLQTSPPFHPHRHTGAPMMAKLRLFWSYLSQCPPASRSRHDGGTGESVFDHMRIHALPHQSPLRLDFDSKRCPPVNPRRSRIVLRRSRPGDPRRCNSEHRKPHNPYAHGFVPG